MKRAASLTFCAVIALGAHYLIPINIARADSWGCQVILCLSNPGGATQFAECRPPVEKLWKHLAKGYSFPVCVGAGVKVLRPGYEPYYCHDGYRLVSRYGDQRRETACVSVERQTVSNASCHGKGSGADSSPISARWVREGDRTLCKAYVTQTPNRREQPRFVDVTIDGVGRQRIWF